jgi:hypothetical protein
MESLFQFFFIRRGVEDRKTSIRKFPGVRDFTVKRGKLPRKHRE